MEIGTRVTVDLAGFANNPANRWVHKYLKHGTPARMTGTIKRHADNGKTGIEFDELILENLPNTSNTGSLHGTGREGYCLYVARTFYRPSREEVRPQGDIAQSMEDTMLDHEYGMDEDEYMDIVGF